MSVKVEKLEKSTVKLTITVPGEKLDGAIQKAYLKEKNGFNIPGFRKGKVPRQMIERMYGVGVFYEEAANILLQESYGENAKESGEKILTRPDVEIVQIEKGKDFIYSATVGVYPEITLGKYKGIQVPAVSTTVTKADIEEELKAEQEKNSRIVPVEDRPAQKGDIVTLDYEGKIDGVAFEGGTAQNHPLTLGSNSFIPGFEDQLVGVKADEERDVKVTFPKDYHAEDLKGKEAVFHCVIKKIEKKEMPELNDEFASDVSEFDTLEEFKKDIKKRIKERKEKEAKSAKINAAVDAAAEEAKMELSDMLITEQTEAMFSDMANRFQQQGISIDQYMQIMKQTKAQVLEQMKPDAIKRLKTQFTLEKIAQVENLQATDEKVEERLSDMAKAYNMEIEKVKELMSDEYIEEMKEEMKTQMAAEFLGDNAVEVKETPKKSEPKEKKEESDTKKTETKEKKKASPKKTDSSQDKAKKAAKAATEKEDK